MAPGPPRVVTQPNQPARKDGPTLSACPQCGTKVRPDRLDRHLKERCPKLHLRKTVIVANARAKPDRSFNRTVQYGLPWVCPECLDIICGPEATQSVALELWRKHENGSHVTDWTKAHPSRPIRARAPISYVLCPKCGENVREDSTGLHFLSCRPSGGQAKSFQVPIHRLSFTLLPPGEWDIRDVIEHYRNASHTFPSGLLGRKIDNSRLEKIASLRPLGCYIGKESWSGYVVFEFSGSNCVVLECPFEGNASYVLWGDWKAMVGHTKGEIRREFENRYTKVVHKGDWLSRIREALRSSWDRR